ncbi:MAG: hypothetical protein BWY27_00091 [Bacteroidetes bacterium ADurb.Bin234]|nr:MAG: hypothetical protein BWY27_00091 [Bacteroidetes bacterium ADurb.Bin234]
MFQFFIKHTASEMIWIDIYKIMIDELKWVRDSIILTIICCHFVRFVFDTDRHSKPFI